MENILVVVDKQARSEEHLAQEQAWLSSEKIWLLHRGGFTPATKCGIADPDTGKLRIRLTTSGEELLVDEEDVEKVSFAKIYLTLIRDTSTNFASLNSPRKMNGGEINLP